MIRFQTYGLERDGDTIKFYCDCEEVVDKICDYIEMTIDAEQYRRQLQKVRRIECDDD